MFKSKLCMIKSFEELPFLLWCDFKTSVFIQKTVLLIQIEWLNINLICCFDIEDSEINFKITY